MITKEDYLKAKEIVKQYNSEQKTKKPKTNKRLILLEKSNEEIKELLSCFFKNEFSYYTYTPLIRIFQKIYEENLNNKIGRSNAIIVLDILQQRNVIKKDGVFGFARYYLAF
jgi:uncharacterized membrane protein (DUF106 family)